MMVIISNFIATSVSGFPFEKMYEFITFYSNVLSIDYKVKSSMYLPILFQSDLSLYLKVS